MYKDARQRRFARELRNNMTDAENHLWRLLRCQQLHGYKFRRQAAIGDYIVDFVCFARKLIIELDGGQHNEPAVRQYDESRTQWLLSQGFSELRFWNHEVFDNPVGVVTSIWRSLEHPVQSFLPPPFPALPTSGREQY